MLNILVYESCEIKRKRMETIINDYILMEELYMKIMCTTDLSSKLSTYVESHSLENGLYILQLQNKDEDLALAADIRKHDPYGFIVFISSSNKYLPYIFQYKVEALDCIVENDAKAFAHRLRECLKVAYSQTLKFEASGHGIFKIKNGKQTRVIPVSDIHFFESHPEERKIICYFGSQQIEFCGTIRDIERTSPVFYRAHMSYVVNTTKIKSVDRQTNEIKMANGKRVFVAPRKIPQLLNMLSAPFERMM